MDASEKPLYKQIEDFVLDQIDKGIYTEGEPIPTEVEFCKLFNTSRATVNKALNILAYNGVIYRTAGKGTFVRMYSMDKQMKKLMGFTEQMKMLNVDSSTEIIGYSRVKADRIPKVKELFKLGNDDFIHKIERVRYVEHDPIAVECIHISPKVISNLQVEDIGGSLYNFIEETLGVKIGSSNFVISAMNATEELKAMFPCEVNVPLLKYEQETFLMNGVVFEYNEIYYLSNKYQYKGSNFR